MEKLNLVNEHGEMMEVYKLEDGDKITSASQIDSYNKVLSRKINGKNFIFALYKRCDDYMKDKKLKPQDITRLIMLSTYCNYDNRLMITERTTMTKKDMKKILRESSQERFNTFYNNLIEQRILIEIEGVYYISNHFFNRGQTKIKDNGATRLFYDDIRYLFNSVKVTDFKRMGYVFKLLPYISQNYNVICSNPLEPDINLVRTLTSKEIAELLNVSVRTISRTLQSLSNIKVNNQNLLGWVTVGSNQTVIINPEVLYSGKPIDENTCETIKTFTMIFRRSQL